MPKATLLLNDKTRFDDSVRVWAVPAAVEPSAHGFKYSLFYGHPGKRLVGYDNERGKGDHRHIGDTEHPYVFVSLTALIEDFYADVAAIRGEPP